LHEIFREGWQWANEQMIKFWWRSRSRIPICIVTLVRCTLAEVCTVPVLLITEYFSGPGRAVCLVCVCVCAYLCPDNNLWFEWSDLWLRYSPS